MLVGVGIIALGMLLMVGGKSDDPNVFKTGEVYGTMRITIAPILILLGLVVEIFAIFKRSKPTLKTNEDTELPLTERYPSSKLRVNTK